MSFELKLGFRMLWLLSFASGLIFLAGCGGDSAVGVSQVEREGVEGGVVDAIGMESRQQDLLEVEDRDHRLNRDWVEKLLVENERSLDSIERRYEAILAEAENLQAASAGDSLVDLRVRLRRLLEKEQEELDRLAEYVSEMRRTLKEDESR